MRNIIDIFLFCIVFIFFGCNALQYGKNHKITTEKDFIKELYITKSKLDKRQKKDISRFMETGYKQDPELKTMRIVPIYAIFGIKKWEKYKIKPVKDSLLSYLNPSKLKLYQALIYKGDKAIGIAYSDYINRNEQPIGCGYRTYAIDRIIKTEHPDLIFYVANSSDPLFILKDNKLYCYSLSIYETKKHKEKSTVEEYIKGMDDSKLYWLLCNAQKIIPPMYAN